jgi:hypothetical protein
MLKNRYHEILIGQGLISLIRGVISLSRNRSTLLIDDARFMTESYPSLYLSELEIHAFLRLGKKYSIPELIDIRKFLTPARIDFVFENNRTQMGRGPLLNLKELLRKFPELIDESDLDIIYKLEDEEFHLMLMKELVRFENLSYEGFLRAKTQRFEIQGPAWLKSIFSRLKDRFNRPYEKSGSLKYASLLHLLGVSFEEKLKTSLSDDEIAFYFFRLLSPVYRLQEYFLSSQLKRRLSLLGGDFKESKVQFWQFYRGRFENLLLESFEGVISGERVLIFSDIPEGVPFKLRTPFGQFKKCEIRPQKRKSSPFPSSSVSYLTHSSQLGSQVPFSVVSGLPEFESFHWPYPDLLGSKTSFYETDALKSFGEYQANLPFSCEQTEFNSIGQTTLDLRNQAFTSSSDSKGIPRLPLQIIAEERLIEGFEYWGLFRYQKLGLLAQSYGVEDV